jgi:hypothetical protein
VASDRGRELWRDRRTGEAYLVETDGDRVVAATGPVSGEHLDHERVAFEQAAEGRSPGFTPQAAELERRRDEFDREPLAPPR